MIALAQKLARLNDDPSVTRVLILGGTADAVRLAQAASALPEIEVIYSLAGVTRQPTLPGCRMRSGGFGGTEGFQHYLSEEIIDVVLDATHPFALQINDHAATACGALNVPYIRYRRPPWLPQSGDQWQIVENIVEAAASCAEQERRTFLTIGTNHLEAFGESKGIWFLLRTIDPPKTPPPLAQYELALGRGPFSLEDEIALMRKHQIELLISRSSGGTPRAAKLDAAQQLNIPVIVIKQPEPTSEIIEDETAVMERLQALI